MEKSKKQRSPHKPVLVNEVISSFQDGAPLKDTCIIDATFGFGGHAIELAKKGAKILAIDFDPETIEAAEEYIKACPVPDSVRNRINIVHGNFKDIDRIAKENSFDKVDGILFDLGVSTYQLTSSERGFSFVYADAPLDMRMDKKTQGVTAADLVNALNERQLSSLFARVLGRNRSRTIAKVICRGREDEKIETVADFLRIIEPFAKKKTKLRPGTLELMALRMAVNSELENIKLAIEKSKRLLKKGGRMVVISFHSGEDALVKQTFVEMQNAGVGRTVGKEAIKAGAKEIAQNSSARSAKMRVFEIN